MPAGTTQYQVSFKIITKAMISNMLNYPNPFTTSTAFVFTITGSEVPQNIKIQILTITGKIVREITKDELGPLHIGRNITEFKWDGTDMYHQRSGEWCIFISCSNQSEWQIAWTNTNLKVIIQINTSIKDMAKCT